MKISTRGRYALKIMLDIAANDKNGPVPLKDISMRQDIALKYMEQIVSPLAKSGMVTSIRGSNGGYLLAKSPKDYTCGDILRVVEGPLKPTVCLENGDGSECPMSDGCATLPFWQGLSKAIDDYVDSVTLADLALGALDKENN